jgi:hypothetical protein
MQPEDQELEQELERLRVVELFEPEEALLLEAVEVHEHGGDPWREES